MFVIVIKLDVVVGSVDEHIVVEPYPLITPSTGKPVVQDLYEKVCV
jgi:hypothetical protein